MVLITQKWDKVLNLIFEYPNHSFTVRELSGKTEIPVSTVQRCLVKLRKEGFITKENQSNINLYYKFRKSLFMINKIYEIGLIDHLTRELNPSVIIVFGSVRKGEYEKDSDIDLFIESSIKKKINLGKYEKKLGHRIQMFIESDMNKLQPDLFNNIINGIKLYGSFKVK